MAEIRETDIREPFATLWRGQNVFACAAALTGKVYRSVKNRRTLRFEEDGKGYFIKYHGPTGIRELLKNLLQLKLPVFGAENEYRAIRKLESLGVATMTIRAYASRGSKPCGLESFLVTDEITGHISLEDFCRSWPQEPPSSELKHRLIEKLAETCARMHFAGIDHRDCYLCHFLLDMEEFRRDRILLRVLDLHRAEIRPVIPRRMRVKDLAGIFFSSMDLGLGRRSALRFIAVYRRGGPLPRGIWQQVWNTAVRLYRKEYGKEPPAFGV